MNHPPIIGIGTANPSLRLTQEQSVCVTGYETEGVRKIFLNSDIDFRHFYVEGTFNRNESSDELNQRYLGAIHIGCRAIVNCLNSCGLSAEDVDFLAVCTCTGYVCPDIGSRLVAHMGFKNSVQRACIVGLGCAGAGPALQRVTDFVRANPRRKALMLAVEICSACYFVDRTLETVVGNAICADGAAAFLLSATNDTHSLYPRIIDLRALSTRNESKKLGFNTGMESCELSLASRSNTWQGQ